VEYKSKYTMQQLLVEIDGFTQNSGIVVIAATNKPEILDAALVRSGRFDRRVQVTMPDVKARDAMIKLYLKDQPLEPERIAQLAKMTIGFTGADISNMVNTARIEAAKRGQPALTFDLLTWARENIYLGRQRKSAVVTDFEKKTVAWHEAGHAIAALKSPGGSTVESATIVPRGQALGVTMFEPEINENLGMTKERMLAELVAAMGGRVAEEIVNGPSGITAGMSFLSTIIVLFA
jgi:ATP-dependent Zn protease